MSKEKRASSWGPSEGPTLGTGETATLTCGDPFPTVLTVKVLGFTSAGDVVLQDDLVQVFVLTNNTYQTLDTLSYDEPGSICFLPGTRIATPGGEVVVETLRPGDFVLTADGRAVPVRFLGRQTVLTLFTPPERANPIRIMAGALADNFPARDLLVSPNHGIVVDGVLAIASALTNGSTIAQVPPPAERFLYYSIETEHHEVILAENCPAETFMDHVPRARWDNYHDYLALYLEEHQIPEMDLPHAKSHRQVPAETHARIAKSAAAILGHTRNAA